MNIAIVEDNNIYLKYLEKKIHFELEKNNIECKIVSYQNGECLLKQLIEGEKFDCIFLDYNMPNINGFNLGKSLRKYDSKFKLVYISSVDNAVYECLQNDVFRFIRKMNFENEIKECIKTFAKKLCLLNSTYKFETEKGNIDIHSNNILYFDSVQRNIFMYTEKDQYKLKGYKLKELYDKFYDKNYIYTCRGTIVNLLNVKDIVNDEIYLINDDKLNISRRKLKEVKSSYYDYIENN